MSRTTPSSGHWLRTGQSIFSAGFIRVVWPYIRSSAFIPAGLLAQSMPSEALLLCRQ